MREHRARNDVADSVNAFNLRAKMLVHFDPLPIVEFHPDLLRTDSFREGAPSDGNQHFVGLESHFLPALYRGGTNTAVLHLQSAHFRLEVKGHSLSSQRALQEVRHFQIKAEGDTRKEFENGDGRAEAAPD